jgi:hypothetical protein
MEEARSSKLSLARNRDEGNQSGQTTLKPILVTGAHRSGTTWVGRMLSLSSSVAYVHEPFNINNTHSAGGMGFRNWFTYIPDEDIDLCVRRMERIIKLEDPLGSDLPKERRGALLKDPIALFSAEWLASQFDMNVIVLVRNPLAFAGSLKVQSWTYPFEHFLNQPKLMGEHLSPFADEIRRYAEEPPDIIDLACLLWNCIYSVVHSYREKHPDWIFLRHEDASWQPVSTFKVLYDRLGLRFTEEISTQVEAYTDPGKEEGVQQHRDVMRDSRSNIMSWQKRLTSSEIERVRARTASVAEFFYSGEDWSLSQQRLLR